jgi:putative nucleotidyltransferase-like protein
MSTTLQNTFGPIRSRRLDQIALPEKDQSLRREHRLLLSCAGTSLRQQDREAIIALAASELDWPFLIGESRRHGLMPLLYSHLVSTCRERVPHQWMAVLEDLFRRNAVSNMLMSGEMFGVLNLLERNDVPAFTLKGPTLAAAAYCDLALRQFADVDIMVHPSDVIRASRLLTNSGYSLEPSLSSAQERACLRTDCEFTFRGPLYLELQWEIVPAAYCCKINHQQLWSRLDRVRIAGRSVPVPAAEDLLLILCVHGSKHCWERLGWIVDVAEHVKSCPDIQWDRVLDRARSLGYERMMLLGLVLASELLALDLPQSIARLIDSDTSITRLVRDVSHGLFSASDEQGRVIRSSLFYVRTRERLRDRLKCLLRMSLMPSVSDIRSLPSFALKFPFYLLFRPLRLVSNWIAAGAKRLI